MQKYPSPNFQLLPVISASNQMYNRYSTCGAMLIYPFTQKGTFDQSNMFIEQWPVLDCNLESNSLSILRFNYQNVLDACEQRVMEND
jgi:hypothetical protein